MTASEDVSFSCASTSVAWSSLISRSLAAWAALDRPKHQLAESTLQSYTDLDDFLTKFSTGLGGPMFWFFQTREAFVSQDAMTKWNRDRLDDYIILPGFPGFVTRDHCFFVSHFWHTHDDPDPEGRYLRLMQKELEASSWSYIWVDWTCLPQEPRSHNEEVYFLRALRTVPAIIRNCGFMWYYPGFEPRLWILYEVAEYVRTCENASEHLVTEDIKEFMGHITEMQEVGVGATLDKYGYKCTFARDKEFIAPWLELLVLLNRLGIDVDDIRRVQDGITWFRSCESMVIGTFNGTVKIERFEGTLTLGGREYKFAPFTQWVSFLPE
ncbi:hypothetical protein DHEL01_v201336 [Diaporthe helianthi]|uniref:Heterokaryon incompatibility domain-containing protein n=1 Tax=Diaporthe helianthi TaxID=158607 RepID=A0A2P5ICU3_DIAHE|nr:hypothetical protein DHEL01_v201336 [Diaporthe helianthi]